MRSSGSSSGFARRLDAIGQDTLNAVDRVDSPMLDASIRGRIFELEEDTHLGAQPAIYADTLATSLASQMVFDYAPAAERGRRVVSKLRQVPALLQSARDNIKDPPGLFVKTAVETLRGCRPSSTDLPRALATVDDLSPARRPGRRRDRGGPVLSAPTPSTSRRSVGPTAKGTFRLGEEKFEKKLRARGRRQPDADRLLAIALRELPPTQEEFRALAGRQDGGKDPLGGVGGRSRPSTRRRATSSRRRVPRSRSSQAFLERSDSSRCPTAMRDRGADAAVLSLDVCEPVDAGARSRRVPLAPYYYLTDVDPSGRRSGRRSTCATSATPRSGRSPCTRSTRGTSCSSSTCASVESHAAQVDAVRADLVRRRVGALRRADDDRAGLREAQTRASSSDSSPSRSIRLARLIVGIRLHTEDLSVEQGMRFFRDEAFLEESSARREAERGTFDPSYVVYSLGKLMLLKLRADVQATAGRRLLVEGVPRLAAGQRARALPRCTAS